MHQMFRLALASLERTPTEEDTVSKETPRPETTPAAPFAPIFTLWRAALDEMERGADLWAQHGAGHAEEAVKLARSLRGQALAIARGAVDTVERSANEAAANLAAWNKGFAPRSAA